MNEMYKKGEKAIKKAMMHRSLNLALISNASAYKNRFNEYDTFATKFDYEKTIKPIDNNANAFDMTDMPTGIDCDTIIKNGGFVSIRNIYDDNIPWNTLPGIIKHGNSHISLNFPVDKLIQSSKRKNPSLNQTLAMKCADGVHIDINDIEKITLGLYSVFGLDDILNSYDAKDDSEYINSLLKEFTPDNSMKMAESLYELAKKLPNELMDIPILNFSRDFFHTDRLNEIIEETWNYYSEIKKIESEFENEHLEIFSHLVLLSYTDANVDFFNNVVLRKLNQESEIEKNIRDTSEFKNRLIKKVNEYASQYGLTSNFLDIKTNENGG